MNEPHSYFFLFFNVANLCVNLTKVALSLFFFRSSFYLLRTSVRTSRTNVVIIVTYEKTIFFCIFC